MKRNFQSGFSLIEIMVVIVIMGLMMGIVAPQVMDQISIAEETTARQDMESINKALKSYYLDNYDYPSTEQGIIALVEKTDIDPVPRRFRKNGYLEKLPIDPWGNEYVYEYEEGKVNIHSLGKDGMAGGDDRDADIYFREESS